jgi:hypothetical protein
MLPFYASVRRIPEPALNPLDSQRRRLPGRHGVVALESFQLPLEPYWPLPIPMAANLDQFDAIPSTDDAALDHHGGNGGRGALDRNRGRTQAATERSLSGDS